MKKFLALFLTFSMLLSLLTMPTVADTVGDTVATPTPTTAALVANIAQDVQTVEYDKVTYTVIRDLAGLKGIQTGGSYILANNIDCGPDALPGNVFPVKGGFTLEGNGYAVTLKINNSRAGHGLFGQPADNTTTTIRNITFNVSGKLSNNSTGVLIGTSAGHFKNAHVNFENVIMNCSDLRYDEVYATGMYDYANAEKTEDYRQGMRGAGLFYAKVRTNASFKNCMLTGTFSSASNSNDMGVGGFVGLADCNQKVTIEFENCKATGSYRFTNNISSCNAIFIGKLSGGQITTTFKNCELDANISAQFAGGDSVTLTHAQNPEKTITLSANRDGGFIGFANSAASVSFEGCTVAGAWSFAGEQSGCYVGYANVPCSFQNCTISGTNTFSSESTGGFVGYINGGTVTFANSCVSSNNTYSASYTGGFVGYVNGGTATFTSSGVSGNNTYSASCTGGFIGLQGGGTASIDNCTVSGNQTFTKGKSAGFVGDNRAPLSFTGCSITGKLDSTEKQVGGYIGCSEYNNGDTNLTSCTADVTVTTTNDRVSPFVGQAYSNGTVNFNQCKVSGRFISSAHWNGGFMGVAGGSYNTTQKTAKVNFTGCDADIFMIGSSSVASYVGSNGGGNPTITFDACKNNATVYALSSAGSWIAYPNSGDAKATLVFKNACQNNAKLYSNSIFNDKNLYVEDAAWEKAADPEIANGAFAYEIAQAQKAIGITDPDYLYGQEIGIDLKPVIGGKTVYKLPLPQTDPVYSNAPIFENYYLIATDGTNYQQVDDLGDKYNHRIIIPIQEDKMISLASLEVEVVYTLKNGRTKTLRVNQDQLTCLCAVYAGDQIAVAPEGYLLLALTVHNIPKSEWDGSSIEVEVTETPLDSALTLKFASYNIYQSRYDKEAGTEMQNIAKVILDNGLEVIGLQEVDKNTSRTPFDVLQKLKDATGYYGAYFKAMDHLGGEYGDAILSKYEIVETKSWILEAPGGGEPRALGLAVINVNGVKINFFVTHLCHVSDENRKAQLQQIAAILSEYDNYVLTGDFNTDNFSLFSEIEGSEMVNNENFNIVTFPNNYYSIDNIVYSSKNWRFGIPHTIKESYSDHYALYATGVFMK